MASTTANTASTASFELISLDLGNRADLLSRPWIAEEIDRLGTLSGIAQNLKVPITSTEKIRSSKEEEFQSLILAVDNAHPNHLLGFIKFGRRSLYFYDKKGAVSNLPSQLCCLDFIVEEAQQRAGVGKALFAEYIGRYNVAPNQIAYDRPSPKLFSFLRKHYNLENPDIQPNKFAIYENFKLK